MRKSKRSYWTLLRPKYCASAGAAADSNSTATATMARVNGVPSVSSADQRGRSEGESTIDRSKGAGKQKLRPRSARAHLRAGGVACEVADGRTAARRARWRDAQCRVVWWFIDPALPAQRHA